MRILVGTILFLGAVMLFTGFGLARLQTKKRESPPRFHFESVRNVGGSDRLRTWRQSFHRAPDPAEQEKILVAAATLTELEGREFLQEVATGAADPRMRERAKALLSSPPPR